MALESGFEVSRLPLAFGHVLSSFLLGLNVRPLSRPSASTTSRLVIDAKDQGSVPCLFAPPPQLNRPS